MRYAILSALVSMGCVTGGGGGWSEGDPVDAEIRRVLDSGPGGRMLVTAGGGVYTLPASRLERERGRLVAALRSADTVRWWGPEGRSSADVFVYAHPDPDQVYFCAAPRVAEIDYPGEGRLYVRRLEATEGPPVYLVELRDRQTGPDRDSTYRMWVRGAGVEAAWRGVEHAAARQPAKRAHPLVDPFRPPGPRDIGVDFRGLAPR